MDNARTIEGEAPAPAPDADVQIDRASGNHTHEALPPLGTIVRIWNDRLRMLGVSSHALVLANEAPPFHLYLVPDANGAPGLVSFERWRELRKSGAAEVLMITPPPLDEPPNSVTTSGKLAMTCAMLDAAHVPNGAKAIAIYLHQHWSEDLRRRFGEPDNPNTLRRWRIRRRAEPPG